METSAYGAELVALRVAVEFKYKFRMMGIPFEGPSQALCDNMRVVPSASLRSSDDLKKKHNDIADHRVTEAVATKIERVCHIKGKENIADVLTKATDGPTFRKHMKVGLTPS